MPLDFIFDPENNNYLGTYARFPKWYEYQWGGWNYKTWSNGVSTTPIYNNLTLNNGTTANYVLLTDYFSTTGSTYNVTFAPVTQATPVIHLGDVKQLAQEKKRLALLKARAARAKNKARKLLLEHLDIRQTADFEKFGFFFIVGSEGNLYQIRTGRSHNVRLFDPIAHKPIYTLCAHPIEAVPDFDTMLAQKLWIEHDEPAFVSMANRGLVVAREREEAELTGLIIVAA